MTLQQTLRLQQYDTFTLSDHLQMLRHDVDRYNQCLTNTRGAAGGGVLSGRGSVRALHTLRLFL